MQNMEKDLKKLFEMSNLNSVTQFQNVIDATIELIDNNRKFITTIEFAMSTLMAIDMAKEYGDVNKIDKDHLIKLNRIIAFLNNKSNAYFKDYTELIIKSKNRFKNLEDMTKEELINYIKEKQ